MIKLFRSLTKFETGLWLSSVTVITASFIISQGGDVLTLIASLIGVTALIFIAKGYVFGQILVVIFSLFYGVISFFFHYYGEMITYLCMAMPMEVEVNRLTKKQTVFMWISAVFVTAAFYFILSALKTPNSTFSTLSVTTSYVASFMTLFRSPYYAIGYSANDIVLIVLWILASMEDLSYLPMVLCFVMFLANDIYGFYNWKRMQTRQSALQK